MDWGFKTKGCIHWWALSPDDVLVCEKELTFQGKLAGEVAKEIVRIERGMGLTNSKVSKITGPADDQIREERGDPGNTKEQEFIRNGVSWVMANKKSKQRPAELIVQRLRSHRDRTRDPGLMIFACCPKLQRDLLDIQVNPKDPEVPFDTPRNHWYASLRYAISYADGLSSGLGEEQNDPDGFECGEFADDDRGYGYGRYEV